MAYFRCVSIVLGTAMVLGGLWVSFAQGWWKTTLVKLYPEKRPQWFVVIGVVSLVFFLITCYFFLKNINVYSFVVTFVVSISLLKAAAGFFFYQKVRAIVLALMEEPLALRVVMLSTAAVGLALLALGFF